MALRAAPVTLEAARSQEAGELRRIFLDLVRVNGQAGGDPGPPDLGAFCWLDFADGGGRPLFLRGLPSRWIRHKRTGEPDPPRELLDHIYTYFSHMQRLDFRGRERSRDEPWAQVKRLSPDGPPEYYTRVETLTPFEPAVGDYVYFGAPDSLAVTPERFYWVTRSDPDSFTIFHPWPGVRDEVFPNARVKRLTFEYPRLERIQFRRYGSHKTGGTYRLATWEPAHPRSVPLSTCQRGVDYLVRAYTTNMRFWPDDPGHLEPVRWYFPTQYIDRKFGPQAVVNGPPVTVLPDPHPFGSRNWELDTWPELPIGETYERSEYHHGQQRSILTGLGLGGDADVWTNGATAGTRTLRYSPRSGWP